MIGIRGDEKQNSVLGRSFAVETNWFYHFPQTDYKFSLLLKASDHEGVLILK